MSTFTSQTQASRRDPQPFTFFAISDFGNPTKELKQVARAMHEYALQTSAPELIIGLGDNFYPHGVDSPDDSAFQEVWSDIFLQYETLQVPWKMILGNHDYMSNPYAQIEFTTHEKNTMNLWQMPHNYYKFSSKSGMADFFAVDTNGCQGHVQRSHPGTINNLFSQMEWLDRAMKTSSTEWKFVVGHHPMYNKGKGHGSVANCLREKQFSQRVRPRGKNYLPNEYEIVQVKGFGMEDIVSEHSKTVYLSGHEHVFQHHYAKGVQHIICGNSGAEVRGGEGFYGGPNENVSIDWHDTTNTFGFVAVSVSEDSVKINFVDSRGQSFHDVTVDGGVQRNESEPEQRHEVCPSINKLQS